jgi:hypothetical protein
VVATSVLLIDWLRVTFPGTLDALDRAKALFGPGLEWVEMDRGGFFFGRCLRRGHVSIYFEGKVAENAGLVLVDVSGQGCRQLEAEGVLDVPCEANGFEGGWRGFLGELQALGCTFPRVDWALDDTEGSLDLDEIERCWDEDRCASRFQDKERRRRTRRGGELVADSLNFGSRTSQMFVRIYNKRLERLVKGEPADALPAHWVRTELEAKGRGGSALVAKFVEHGSEVVSAALRHYLDFKVEGGDSNVSRRASCPWWESFLGRVKAAAVGIGAAARSLEGMAKALWRQWSAGLRLLMEAPAYGPEWFSQLLQQGEMVLHSRETGEMKSRYRVLLSAAASAPAELLPDGSGPQPVMCPELVPPLGQVENRAASECRGSS